MPHPGVISISVEATETDRLTVVLAGELSDATAPTLAGSLIRLIVRANRASPPRQTLVIDLAGIGTYTRGGVSALWHARRVADQTGIDLQLAGLDGRWQLLPQQVAHDLIGLGTSPPTPTRDELRSHGDPTAGAAASSPGPQGAPGPPSPVGRRIDAGQTVTGPRSRSRTRPPVWTLATGPALGRLPRRG